jgi:putative hydrolase of HD superfamily
MTLQETRKRIMEDDEFVMSEVSKLSKVYRLKREIRAGQKRLTPLDTESVAEHIFGMHVLANYFLPIEDIYQKLSKIKVLETVTWHDLDEVETGDIMAHLKTDEHRKRAELALRDSIQNLPEAIRDNVDFLMNEYESKTTLEAKFVRAIDKLEPIIEMYSGTEGYKTILHDIGFTLTKHWEIKTPHIVDYPYIHRFAKVVTDDLDRKDYFPI